jgi:hypothetical protein
VTTSILAIGIYSPRRRMSRTMNRRRQIVVGLVVRCGCATLLALIGWWSCVTARAGETIRPAICRVLDWPVATVGLLFPKWWAGIDAFYGRNLCDFCTPSERLVRHLEFAIPVCILLFYIPALIKWAAEKRGRSQPTTRPKQT